MFVIGQNIDQVVLRRTVMGTEMWRRKGRQFELVSGYVVNEHMSKQLCGGVKFGKMILFPDRLSK